MSESLFSALRIVAMMLAADHKVSTMEKAWFTALMNGLGPSFAQRQTLMLDLLKPEPHIVEELFERIGTADRPQFFQFLQAAMRADGKISAEENDFLKKVYKLNESVRTNLSEDYMSMGRELLKRDQEIRLWKNLEASSNLFSRRLRYPVRYGLIYRELFSLDLPWTIYYLGESFFARPSAIIKVVLFFVVIMVIFKILS